jgi:molybdopterin molybdotransferase
LATYSFRDARRLVIEQTLAARKLETEVVPLSEAAGRVIAEFVSADRDYPPVARSIRDGFAVRAADLPGTLDLIGEVRAGGEFAGEVGVGECVEIMTGAAVPKGADAIVMVEYAARDGGRVSIDRRPAPREFINPGGSEARAGQAVMPAGFRLGFTQIALLATFGKMQVKVYRRPRVAILSTGDEIVPIEATPLDTQVRNSNAHSVAVQVARAGGVPTILPVAPDERKLRGG